VDVLTNWNSLATCEAARRGVNRILGGTMVSEYFLCGLKRMESGKRKQRENLKIIARYTRRKTASRVFKYVLLFAWPTLLGLDEPRAAAFCSKYLFSRGTFLEIVLTVFFTGVVLVIYSHSCPVCKFTLLEGFYRGKAQPFKAKPFGLDGYCPKCKEWFEPAKYVARAKKEQEAAKAVALQ
jgi:hypothetical protein